MFELADIFGTDDYFDTNKKIEMKTGKWNVGFSNSNVFVLWISDFVYNIQYAHINAPK